MTALRRLSLLPLLVLPLAITACDNAGDEGDVFTLPGAREVEFRFRPAQFNPGEDVAVAAVAPFQSASILTNGTFTYAPSSVTSARIDGGEVLLLLDQPISAMLSTYQLSEIVLQLQVDNGPVQMVARRSDFSGLGSERRVTLPVTNADVTSFLRRDSFSASLIFDFGNAPTAATEFSVEFDVRIEVEA